MMHRYKRLLSSIPPTLVVLFVSVFLFGGVAHAQDVEDPRPLSVNEQIIQDQSKEVEQKSEMIESAYEETKSLQAKKKTLTNKLETEKKKIQELKKKIAAKKAAEAEKARLAEIAAQEQAEMEAYIAPYVEPVRAYISPRKRYTVSSAGNTYTPGQCTWHVKNLKPELPNMLGNADTWFYNAQALGWPVGYEARSGAAAQTKAGMHIVYVLEVYGNGTMLISEMNYNWTPYAQRTVVVSQSKYLYIY